MKKLVVPGIIVALLVAAAFTLFGGEDRKTLTALFPRTISVYEGSDVRVLGVPVGTVDSVTPSGTDVVVTMSYDAEVQVPAEAEAVIISPSVVGDRYVQLTPAYTGGDGAGRRRDPRGRPDRGPARARPDLREPRPAQRGARPQRRQPQRCPLRPARGDGRELRRAGRAAQPDHPGLRQVQPDAERQPRGVLQLHPGAAGLHQHAGGERPTVRRLQPVAVRRVHRAGGRARGALRGPRRTCRRRWARSRRSSATTGRSWAATSRASTGSARCWSSSGPRSTRSSRSPRPPSTTWR